MINFSRTDSGNKNFQDLIVLLDEYLKVTDGDEHSFYAQFNPDFAVDFFMPSCLIFIDGNETRIQ